MPTSLPLRIALGVLAAGWLTGCERSPYRTVTVETHAGQRSPAPADERAASPLRFSVASMESPRDTYSGYTRLFDRMGEMLHVAIQFEQRRTYREVNDLIIAGKLDAALLCTGGYLDLERRAPGSVEVLAVPLVGGQESYRSVIIVPASSPVHDLRELEGKRFAFTDELSFSGRLYAERLLRDRNLESERFFSDITYTGSHDRSIQAVARGLIDGAAVHGGILAQMEERDAELGKRIRIIHSSPPLGGMPVVVSTRVPAAERTRLKQALLGLHLDQDGAASLRMLRFDRFAEPAPDLYVTAARILEH